MDEREFRLGESFFPYFRQMALTRILPVLVIAILVAVFVSSRRSEMDPVLMLVMGVFMALIVGFGGWKGLQRQEESFRGFRIHLDEGSIRRSQPGLPEIAIARESITRIVRVPGKGMTVFGPGRQEIIGIPEALEGFAVVENTLEGWRPFEAGKTGMASWLLLLTGLGTLAAFAVLVLSTDKILVTACGGALLVLMLYSAITVPGSPHLDRRTKRAFWFTPVLIVVIVVQIWRVWAQ
jgi:hypothetical protein